MKVLIIEDEPLAVERLRFLLEDYDKKIEIIGTADSISSAKQWLATHPVPELIFLDIQLADGMSFTIFADTAIKCPVIFTTAYDHYALDAFKLFSIDYLLKPISLTKLASALNKYRDLVNFTRPSFDISQVIDSLKDAGRNYKERFLIKSGSRMFFIETQNISYFYAVDKTVFLVDNDGVRYVIDYTLENLQDMLNAKQFFRLNRKVISNISSIKEIKTYLNKRLRISLQAGKNKEEIIISRDRVQAFKAWVG